MPEKQDVKVFYISYKIFQMARNCIHVRLHVGLEISVPYIFWVLSLLFSPSKIHAPFLCNHMHSVILPHEAYTKGEGGAVGENYYDFNKFIFPKTKA